MISYLVYIEPGITNRALGAALIRNTTITLRSVFDDLIESSIFSSLYILCTLDFT